MLAVTRWTNSARPDWKTPLPVAGAVAVGFAGAKLLRNIMLWAQYSLLPPDIAKFKGEWGLVTGGSEGVGKAVAAELASHGLNVVLVSRSQDKLDAAAIEIKQKHPAVQVDTFSADLTDASSCSKLLRHLSDNNLHISVLVANAGGTPWPIYKPYWEYTDYEETVIRDLNGGSCYSLVRSLLPAMISAGKGAVVCISSGMHRVAAYAAPYGSEKAKINTLCEALDLELHGTGVTAQAMVLGPVVTPAVIGLMHPGLLSRSSSSSSSRSADLAAAMAQIKTNPFRPSAETTAAAIVRSIGRGGPVVIPYWGHSVLSHMLHSWWPPELHRAVLRSFTRGFKADMERLHGSKLAAAHDQQ